MKVCSKCATEKEFTSFTKRKCNKKDGSPSYSSWCNECRTKDNRIRMGFEERPKPKTDEISKTKECLECHEILGFDKFSPSKRGRFGLSAYCRKCQSRKYKNNETARAATAKYREKNLFRWRALHRIHQFNRRNLIKATEDGTVTNDFINFIYNQEICYWCKQQIESDQRTLEHIIELSDGGIHSASNITMACFKCNSSRFNKGRKYV